MLERLFGVEASATLHQYPLPPWSIDTEDVLYRDYVENKTFLYLQCRGRGRVLRGGEIQK